ncbi:MAG TPA: FtsQ-type POTRA domain-containing protein [Candidatus Olsenella avicola]|nr:FtsQ-type POTRA domain-containing protein [Candidatus Olsenella avicola]
MAKDQSRRPTPRKRSGSAPKVKPSASLAPKRAASAKPAKAPKPAKVPKAAKPAKAPKAPKPAKAPKLTMVGSAAKPAQSAKPAAVKQKPSKRLKTPATSAIGSTVGSQAASVSADRPAFLERAASAVSSRRRGASGTRRPAGGAERRQRYQRGQILRVAGIVAGVLVAVALALAVAFFALRNSSVFSVESVQVEPTEHVTEADLQNLVSVPVGSTLLNLDEQAIKEGLLKDPWVADVTFERIFPHTLKINVIEQNIDALVVMNAGSVAWYLGDAGVWIQPTSVEPAEGQSVNDAALRTALDNECLLITDVPASVSPVAGSKATDGVLEAVQKFRDGFSDSFADQVACYSAPAEDSIACTLYNGVEVLLGSPTDISAKEQIVTETLAEMPEGSVTYINVRVVSSPAVRPVSSDNVEAGSGVVSLLEPGQDASGDGSGEGGSGDEGSGEGGQGTDSQGDGSEGTDGDGTDSGDSGYADDGSGEGNLEGSGGEDASQDGSWE